jgi:hypothetical protein
MSILQCILLQLLARPPITLARTCVGVGSVKKHQRSEPSIHFLIYDRSVLKNELQTFTNSFDEFLKWLPIQATVNFLCSSYWLFNYQAKHD